jgi:hypothetical protein
MSLLRSMVSDVTVASVVVTAGVGVDVEIL